MEKKGSNSDYKAESIRLLTSREAIRRQPYAYVIPENPVLHALSEIVANCVDEITNGFGDLLTVEWVQSTGQFIVTDDGRGIPGGKMPNGMSAMEAIFTIKDAGGKFENNGNYKVSGGSFGVGATAVAMLSKELEAVSVNNGFRYMLQMVDGEVKSFSSEPAGSAGSGTTVSFILDQKLFTEKFPEDEVQYKAITDYLLVLSAVAKVNIIMTVRRRTGKSEVVRFKKDLTDSDLLKLLSGRKVAGRTFGVDHSENPSCYGKFIVSDTFGKSETFMAGFVNNSIVCTAGLPYSGIKEGIIKVVEQRLARELPNSKIKGKWAKFRSTKISPLAVVRCVVMTCVAQPLFGGLTKTSLLNPETRGCGRVMAEVVFNKIFDARADALKNYINALAACIPGTSAKNEKTPMNTDLLSKLQKCSPKTPYDRTELWICEGDSGARFAKLGAGSHQSVLPLGGKPLNCWKTDKKNSKLQTLIAIMKQHKHIVIMADADPDGRHIRMLLIAALLKYCPDQLIYDPVIPLFVVISKDGKPLGYSVTVEEADAIQRKNRGSHVSYIKGTGKIDQTQYEEILSGVKIQLIDREAGRQALDEVYSSGEFGDNGGDDDD